MDLLGGLSEVDGNGGRPSTGTARSDRVAVAGPSGLSAFEALLRGLAHEINNPLAYLVANLELLAERLRTGDELDLTEASEMVADSLFGADRIRLVIQQLQPVAGALARPPRLVAR